MSKKFNFAQRVRAMKKGDEWTVASEKDRQAVLRAAKVLYQSGIINLKITTFAHGSGFKVVAI